MLWVVVWVIGSSLRQVVGPRAGEELLTDKCGFNGDMKANADVVEQFPECANRHWLYAHEYCSTAFGCSFTVFRCMIGDCSSRGGQSLTAHFSAGYKLAFDIVYVIAMIFLVFGLFNVITAIFLEATMKGLAAQDAFVRKQVKYQRKHVKIKLQQLVKRIILIGETNQSARSTVFDKRMGAVTRMFEVLKHGFDSAWLASREPFSSKSSLTADVSHITISEAMFKVVLRDESVQSILDELDIYLGTDSASIFRIFRKDSQGQLPLMEMLDTLMILRGDTSKVDVVGSSVMIDGLRDELRRDIHKLQEMILGTHRALGRRHRSSEPY
jgi:hypothetical protein